MKEKSLSSLNGLGTLAGALLVALAGGALFVLGVAAKASTGSPNSPRDSSVFSARTEWS